MKKRLYSAGNISRKLIKLPGPKYRLSVADAQKMDICRICMAETATQPGNPIVLNYGREYAHKKCLELPANGDSLKDLYEQFIKYMAHEIKYICDEAVHHKQPWEIFKKQLLNKIKTEGAIERFMNTHKKNTK